MQQLFDITGTSRKVLSQFLQNYTLDQLNTIPEGFNNNIIWNIGHIVVVQQMLIYKLSGLPMLVSDQMVAQYKRGTKPEADVTQEEVDLIGSLLFETINKTETDFNNAIFKDYQEFTVMTGFTMKNVQDAISFNYYHEALHTGIIMGIRKFI
ncbi:MAG TPA: DinB family protein [Flavobacterium sp.]|jgi:hypothetical protein